VDIILLKVHDMSYSYVHNVHFLLTPRPYLELLKSRNLTMAGRVTIFIYRDGESVSRQSRIVNELGNSRIKG
jgi:hypothetical protein